jgi:hypothetical protein
VNLGVVNLGVVNLGVVNQGVVNLGVVNLGVVNLGVVNLGVVNLGVVNLERREPVHLDTRIPSLNALVLPFLSRSSTTAIPLAFARNPPWLFSAASALICGICASGSDGPSGAS